MGCPSSTPTDYSEGNIPTLTDMEAVRLRPQMYVGNVRSAGLHNLLLELVTNSLAESIAGYGRSVRVTLHVDGSATVSDHGRLPPDVERAFTAIEGPRGFCPYPEGRQYFGYAVANALSEWLVAEALEGEEFYHQGFERGIPSVPVRMVAAFGSAGLTVTFGPDPLIFGDTRFDPQTIRDRLRELAFLHSGVYLSFTDEVNGACDEFEFTDGIREYMRVLNQDRNPLHMEAILLRGQEQNVRYEVGLQWCEDHEAVQRSFANHYFTRQGGTHWMGLHTGVVRGLEDFVREHAPQPAGFHRDDFLEGLTAVVSVWLREPIFMSATRSHLGNPEVEGVVSGAVETGVREYFQANAEAARRVVDSVVTARAAARENPAAKAEQRRQQRRAGSGE